jgi:alpha-tubulin suppressor-like RCC1 family protein
LQAKIVEDLLGYEVVNVSCGASHILAVTNEHELFAWGRGESGKDMILTIVLVSGELCVFPH